MSPGSSERTQVAIVGAGPAGLVLGHLLHLRGIESIVLEARSREYCEQRVRAGLLEDGTAGFLTRIGLGQRLQQRGLVHRGFVFRFAGNDHRIPLSELTDGRRMMIYGQEELIKDLIAIRLATGRPLRFDAKVLDVEQIEGPRPRVVYRHEGGQHHLDCDLIAGCDGFHGRCRRAVNPVEYTRAYPMAWLGIMAAVRPTIDEIVYASHDRGFALHSMRSPLLSRLHLQCRPDEDLRRWDDERIWDELELRLATADGPPLARGAILQKAVIPLRSFVAAPMRRGGLFLAGDAAHIVPPTGAKGLNLAIADVRALDEALARWYETDDDGLLDEYSTTCLRRVWRVERFSSWMTSMLHRFPDHTDFDRKLQQAELEHVCSSTSAATSLAESYVGMDRELAADDVQLATVE